MVIFSFFGIWTSWNYRYFSKIRFLKRSLILIQLMVLALLMFIFVMKHFDSNYVKSTLAMLILSEVLDMIWLFMNSSGYWNPPAVGVNSSHQQAYLKIIILLTYLGIFLKIPLGVFLFHYRNTQSNRLYNLDIGIAKISLNPNGTNPFSEGIKDLDIFNWLYNPFHLSCSSFSFILDQFSLNPLFSNINAFFITS